MFEIPKHKHLKVTDFPEMPQADPTDPNAVQFDIMRQQVGLPKNPFESVMGPGEVPPDLGDAAVRLGKRPSDLLEK